MNPFGATSGSDSDSDSGDTESNMFVGAGDAGDHKTHTQREHVVSLIEYRRASFWGQAPIGPHGVAQRLRRTLPRQRQPRQHIVQVWPRAGARARALVHAFQRHADAHHVLRLLRHGRRARVGRRVALDQRLRPRLPHTGHEHGTGGPSLRSGSAGLTRCSNAVCVRPRALYPRNSSGAREHARGCAEGEGASA